MESVYLETSFISYLTPKLSASLRIALRQQISRDWWQTKRHEYTLYISDQVLIEARAGDPTAAADRAALIQGIEVLKTTAEVLKLADEYAVLLKLPGHAAADALHLAMASVSKADYLLTWNLKHIANPHHIRRLTEYNLSTQQHTPLILTPETLASEDIEDGI